VTFVVGRNLECGGSAPLLVGLESDGSLGMSSRSASDWPIRLPFSLGGVNGKHQHRRLRMSDLLLAGAVRISASLKRRRAAAVHITSTANTNTAGHGCQIRSWRALEGSRQAQSGAEPPQSILRLLFLFGSWQYCCAEAGGFVWVSLWDYRLWKAAWGGADHFLLYQGKRARGALISICLGPTTVDPSSPVQEPLGNTTFRARAPFSNTGATMILSPSRNWSLIVA